MPFERNASDRFFGREMKKEVGECPVDMMMRVMNGRWKGTILWRMVDGRAR